MTFHYQKEISGQGGGTSKINISYACAGENIKLLDFKSISILNISALLLFEK